MERLDDLVGRRVALRHRLGSGRLTDAVGELATEGAALVVHTRRGAVRVARPDVVAVRAVPPPVPRRPSWAAVARLENLCADAWPARVDEPLGAWRLRAAGGFTGRANSALAVGDPGCPLDAALDRVRAFYAARHLEAVVAAPTGPLTEELQRRGWTVRTPTLVMTADVPATATTAALAPGVRLDDAPDRAWLAGYQNRGPVGEDGKRVLLSADQQVFASVRTPAGDGDSGEVLAVARGSLSHRPDGTWLGLSAVETAAVHRRQGLGGMLTATLLAWGAQRGARAAFLQVAAFNSAAQALYERAGFSVHHEYRYLVAPA